MSRIYTIYRATNIYNKKVYIGFDSSWPRRIMGHKRDYINGKYTHKFYNAIKKYGWDAFIWEAIYQAKEDSLPTKSHTLNIIEPLLIAEFDSINSGYNIVKGGNTGPHLPGRLNGMWGKKHTDEVKQKQSLLAKTRLSGKSYIELHGREKAKELKVDRSIKLKKFIQCNPGCRAGNKNSNAKHYYFKDCNGIEYHIIGGLRKFCKEHNLDTGTAIDYAHGRRNQPLYKGWLIRIIN